MTEAELRRAARLWAAQASGYDDADDFGDGSPESWAKLLEAVHSYALADIVSRGWVTMQESSHDLLEAKAAAFDKVAGFVTERAIYKGTVGEDDAGFIVAVERTVAKAEAKL